MTLDRHRAIAEAVDEALAYFGELVKEIVYYYLEAKYGVKRHEVPVRLELFAECLEEIFSYAAHMVESVVVEKLSTKLGVKFRSRSLKKLVEELRKEKPLST